MMRAKTKTVTNNQTIDGNGKETVTLAVLEGSAYLRHKQGFAGPLLRGSSGVPCVP